MSDAAPRATGPEEATVAHPRFGPRSLAPLLLVLAVAGLYSLSWDNDFIYDDHKIIVQHDGVHSFADVVQIFKERHFPRFPYYRPITRTTLLVQKGIWGNAPGPFHLFNAALMGLTALATYLLLRRPQWKIPRAGALLAAAAFVVHPVSSCVVYPICSGRETMLPSLVLILGITAWMTPGRRSYATAVMLLVVALFCKEQAVVFPALFLLADWLGLSGDGRPASWSAWVRRYSPIALLCVGYLVVRHSLFGGSEYQVVVGENPMGPLQSFAYAFQVVLVPFVQLVYEPTVQVWASWWRLPIAIAALVAIVAGGWRTGHPGRRVLIFWLAWFLLFTLPTGNILRQEAPFAERYVFLASLPLFATTAALLSSERWRAERRRLIAFAAGVLILVFAAISASRAGPYHDDRAFAEQWLRTNPEAFEAHQSLGIEYRKEAETLAARRHEIEEPEERAALEKAEDQLYAKARFHYSKAIEIHHDFAEAHLGAAKASAALDDTDAALASVQRALSLLPDDFVIAHGGGKVLLDLGRAGDALPHLRRAAALKPSHAAARGSLGRALCMEGLLDEGLEEFQRAIQLDPGLPAAHYNLAITLAMKERHAEAVPHFEEAVADDGNPKARVGLAEAYWRVGRLDEASRAAQRALLEVPGEASLLLLARVQRDRGDDVAAVDSLRKAASMRSTRDVLRELAWLLATTENEGVVNGPRARQLAETLLRDRETPAALDVHAAACAQAGDFAAAITSARKAISRAGRGGAPADDMAKRLERYERGEPARSTNCYASEERP